MGVNWRLRLRRPRRWATVICDWTGVRAQCLGRRGAVLFVVRNGRRTPIDGWLSRVIFRLAEERWRPARDRIAEHSLHYSLLKEAASLYWPVVHSCDSRVLGIVGPPSPAKVAPTAG
uniref:Uncharacterized protein n=1 Tax=Plectus sambesii TaxID=2011161 RepID=A0A914W0W9_9BILA